MAGQADGRCDRRHVGAQEDVLPLLGAHGGRDRRLTGGDLPLRLLGARPQVRVVRLDGERKADVGLRVFVPAVDLRVVRQRAATTKSLFSEFQERGMSRRQYDAKAIQVAQIVDEVATVYQRHKLRTRQA